ncbi:MAG: M23 family metallopeptidase [Leptonema sp. (in: Bacteria)]|nr:M23 family metallopeptidase [Leptonema sp. (in: bacteria)]
MNRSERWQYRLQEWRKKLQKQHQGGWQGISILICPHDARTPYRIRINYYSLLFPLLLIAIVIFVATVYQVEPSTQTRKTFEILLSNHHLALIQKKRLLHQLEDQRKRLYQISWNQKWDSALNNSFSLQKVEETILNTGSRFDMDLELYRQYRLNSDQLLTNSGHIALKSIWHSSQIYWIMPKGWPVYPGTATISSGYGGRMDPFLKTVPGTFHGGIDFASAPSTPIIATADGVVIRAIEKETQGSGYGKHIIVHHGLGYQSLYAHCSKLLVKAGDRVKKGQVIALVGRTGAATGNHVHYEIRLGLDKPINPVPYISFK